MKNDHPYGVLNSLLGRAGIAWIALLAALLFLSCSESTTQPEEGNKRGPRCARAPLPPPTGDIIQVSDIFQLYNAVDQANVAGNLTIVLSAGTYQLISQISFQKPNISIRGASGNRDDVLILGDGLAGAIGVVMWVDGDDFTIADLTLGNVNGPGLVFAEDTDRALVHNVRFFDTADQMVKVSAPAAGVATSDDGVIEWCLFEYSSGAAPDDYTGGIMIYAGSNWTIRYNTIKDFDYLTGLAGPAILVWNQSSGTTIANNVIYNCDRGIALGLGQSSLNHAGGIVRNNMVSTTDGAGISLEWAIDAKVYNNSVYVTSYLNAIEYRYAETQASIINNLCNKPVAARNGAAGTVVDNMTDAETSWFVDAYAGNLRLAVMDTTVIDKGQALADVLIDVDCEQRPKGSGYDIGADER